MPSPKQTPRGKTSSRRTQRMNLLPPSVPLALELNPLWRRRARRACSAWDVSPRFFEFHFFTMLHTLDDMAEPKKLTCRIFLAPISRKFALHFGHQQDLWSWVPTSPRSKPVSLPGLPASTPSSQLSGMAATFTQSLQRAYTDERSRAQTRENGSWLRLLFSAYSMGWARL